MGYQDFISSIEAEWSAPAGFFWKARNGQLDEQGFERTLQSLRSQNFDEDALLPRRLVSLLWFIPLFMTWQVERIREQRGNEWRYRTISTTIENEIQRLLGVP